MILRLDENYVQLCTSLPCGFHGDAQKPCSCAPAVVTKYQKRISGPLPDRIDIHIEVPRVDYEKLSSDRVGESSEIIRARVQTASIFE
jgi:magnesium chelatase family protein